MQIRLKDPRPLLAANFPVLKFKERLRSRRGKSEDSVSELSMTAWPSHCARQDCRLR